MIVSICLLLLLHVPTTTPVYIHTGGVTTQTLACNRMYIGKSNATERVSTSSFGTSISGGSCDPQLGAGRIEIPSNIGLPYRQTNFWCPSKANPYEFFQITLKEGPTKLGGFLMQGSVTKFQVKYALNDVDSQYYDYRVQDKAYLFENTNDKIITINGISGGSVYKHTLKIPGSALIQQNVPGMGFPLAQHIRFYPKDWIQTGLSYH